jgi:hypothetical protein
MISVYSGFDLDRFLFIIARIIEGCGLVLVLWCLAPLSTKFVAVSFIGGGNRGTWRKSQTCRK